MDRVKPQAATLLVPFLLVALPGALPAQIKILVHLSPATNQAFDKYVAAAESKMDGKPHTPPGELTAVAGSPIDVDGGMIHDWVGGVLVKGASVEKALAMFQDYAAYKKTFAPEVIDSKLLAHDGDRWTTALRISRRNVFTVTFDTEYAVEYRKLDGGRWAIQSRSTRISELDDDGKPLPDGAAQGFLWRLNSYWLIEPRPEGVYLECRAISLSRDIPAGLGWIVKPMIASVPRDSLRATVEEARAALRSREQ
jgi:hypothetical protein